MIKVVCIILTIAIENLEVNKDNTNLVLIKNAIWFELLA